MAITLREVKGSELTHNELDGNFADLDLRTGPGWSDMVAPLQGSDMPTQNVPTLTAFGPAPSIYKAYLFQVGDYCYIQPFHVNHDVKPNGQAYIHVHWTTDGVDVNPVKWEFQILRAIGHNQANFGAVTTLTVTQAHGGTAWRHMVAEVDVGQTLTMSQPDELLLVVLRRVTNGATENGASVFALMVDFHYESDRANAPLKSPPFYQ